MQYFESFKKLKLSNLCKDIIALLIIMILIILVSIKPLSSESKLNFNDDFFQYAGRHESIRKALLEYRVFPLRAFWFGGGYPTIGDPEDPTFNPLIIITLIFGSVMGLKIIPFIAILIGGISAYFFVKYILNYTGWGALFTGIMFGLNLFVPLRIQDGNPNEVYSAFLPLCMLLIGLACRGKKLALLILPFVFYTMISDGKYTALMAFLYICIICLFDILPLFNTLSSKINLSKFDIRPLKFFLVCMIVTFFIGMIRFLPAFELLNMKGGLSKIDLFFMPKIYTPEGVPAYTYQQLWQELIGWKGNIGLVTTGWLPVILALLSFYIFRKESFPFGINLILFGWLLLAHNAPVDLLKILWNLPIFNALYRPYKYFSYQVAYTFIFVSGQFFWLLRRIPIRWKEHILAVILVVAGTWFLYPKILKIQSETYTFDMPSDIIVQENEFYNIQGKDIVRNRKEPLNSLTYTGLLRNIGVIDWYTGIPITENAIPKYFVDNRGNYLLNPVYRGEAFFLKESNKISVSLKPNSIFVNVNLRTPDIAIINQNYHDSWHTNHGELFNMNGLLALQLNETGSYQITLHYIPLSFYLGLSISILSLAFLGFLVWSYKTHRLSDWSKNAPLLLKQVCRVIIFLLN